MSRHGDKGKEKNKCCEKQSQRVRWVTGPPKRTGLNGDSLSLQTHTHTHTHTPDEPLLLIWSVHPLAFVHARVHAHTREHKSSIQPVSCTKCYCGAFPALSLSHSVTKCKLMPRHMMWKRQILHLAKSLWLARMNPPSIFRSFLFEPHWTINVILLRLILRDDVWLVVMQHTRGSRHNLS